MKALYNILAVLMFISATAFLTQDRDKEVMECAEQAGSKAMYLKDFRVKLPAAKQNERPPRYQQAVLLRGNNLYRFNTCSSQGIAEIRIFDSNKMILSSHDQASGKDYNPIQFLCRKTGPYNIVITFKDGQAGECIGIMSHVNFSESRRSR